MFYFSSDFTPTLDIFLELLTKEAILCVNTQGTLYDTTFDLSDFIF